MDKSLDDIINSKRRSRRNTRRGVAKASIIGNKAAIVAPVPARMKTGVPVPTEKIIVSNLPLDVTEAQIRELFSSTVGPLREVTLNYDAQAKSKGIATVVFSKKGDGAKAHAQYNNRLIDGKRPMKIEMVLGPAPPPTLAQRVAPAPAVQGAKTAASRVARRARRIRTRTKRPAKTAQELDTEMEDYTKAETAPAV